MDKWSNCDIKTLNLGCDLIKCVDAETETEFYVKSQIWKLNHDMTLDYMLSNEEWKVTDPLKSCLIEKTVKKYEIVIPCKKPEIKDGDKSKKQGLTFKNGRPVKHYGFGDPIDEFYHNKSVDAINGILDCVSEVHNEFYKDGDKNE